MQSPVEQIKQFLQAIIARRHLFIVVAASIALFAVFSTFFMTKQYEAESTVFIESNVLKNLMQGITVSPSMDDRIRVLRYYMVSRDMVTRTLKKMDMDTDPRFQEPEKFESLVQRCQQRTSIRVRGQDLFIVSLTDPDPAFAKNYINTLVNIYVEENLSDKREESYGANRFLSEQVDYYKQKLDEIDARIIQFRKETGIYSTVNEASVMAQIAQEQEALKQIKSLKTEGYATIKTIRQQLEMLRSAAASNLEDPFAGIGGGNSTDYRIEQLEAKLDELLLVYNDQYPTVVKLRDQIAELKKRKNNQPTTSIPSNDSDTYNPVEDPIYVDLKMRLNTAQSDLNALNAKEEELVASIEANQALLRNFPQDKKTLNDLERERAMQAAIYEKLLDRVSVSEVSKQMEVADKSTTFRIVDPAILPTAPVGTKRIVLMVFGILFGLAAGLGAVYAAEKLDNSLRGLESLRELNVNVLAEIPFIWSEKENRIMRKKDRAAVAFGLLCFSLIGGMLLHDLLRLSFIDRLIS